MDSLNKYNLTTVFHPLVTVVIPVYNGENYLSKAIDSVLTQTYDNVEVLVVNDGSDDNGKTENIALSYGNTIRYYYKDNGGVASALNFGISHMKGEYFSWLSHDDLYHPNKISAQIEVLSNLANKYDIVFAGWTLIDAEEQVLNRKLPLEKYNRKQLEIPLFPLINGMISGCSLLIHKSHFERVGMFQEDLITTQDVDLWFRMMRNISCRVCEGALHMSRVHRGQSSQRLKAIYEQEGTTFWINMMNELTNIEKVEISGSVRKFNKDIYCSLLRHGISKIAKRYAKEQFLMDKNRILKFSSAIFLEVWVRLELFRELLNILKKLSLFSAIRVVQTWISRSFARRDSK